MLQTDFILSGNLIKMSSLDKSQRGIFSAASVFLSRGTKNNMKEKDQHKGKICFAQINCRFTMIQPLLSNNGQML